jgi:hypothetical protein
MRRCRDFQEEETALQHLGAQLGVEVRLTPKFHAELAGEGVEYSWAFAKAFYRRLPLALKKGRDNFKEVVKLATCTVKQLTRVRIRKFAARARAYICTYYILAKRAAAAAESAAAKDSRAGSEDVFIEKQQLLFSDIERLMKSFKVHRCALDFDQRFVNAEFKDKAEIQL